MNSNTPEKMTVFFLLLLLANAAQGGVVRSTTGIVRSSQGNSAVLSWTLSTTSFNYSVFNLTTGIPQNLSSRTSLVLSIPIRRIQLTILNVGLYDAGNYSLSLRYNNTTEVNSEPLLFVFGRTSTFIRQTSGQVPPVEGESVEISCNLASTSSPKIYRPIVFYSWNLWRYGGSQASSGGSVRWWHNRVPERYTSINNSSTLVISPLLYEDMGDIGCYAFESGSPYTDQQLVYFTQLKNMRYKPRVVTTDPTNKVVNVFVGNSVRLRIPNYISNPGLIPSETNWTIINTNGSTLDLPENAVIGSYNSPYLQFILPSTIFYGSFVYTLTNIVGNTTVIFQVLAPGPPDPPAYFKVTLVTHFSVYVKWNCMQSNYNTGSQLVYTVLKDARSNATVGEILYNVGIVCFNHTYTVTFTRNIKSDREYVAYVNSTNNLGTSDTVTLRTRTAKPPRLYVSSETIQINYPVASISFRIEYLSDAPTQYYLQIACFDEYTVQSAYDNIWNVKNGTKAMSIGYIRNTTEYVFDFVLYSFFNNYGSVPMRAVKGLRVNTGTADTMDETTVNPMEDLGTSDAYTLPVTTTGSDRLHSSLETFKLEDSETPTSFTIESGKAYGLEDKTSLNPNEDPSTIDTESLPESLNTEQNLLHETSNTIQHGHSQASTSVTVETDNLFDSKYVTSIIPTKTLRTAAIVKQPESATAKEILHSTSDTIEFSHSLLSKSVTIESDKKFETFKDQFGKTCKSTENESFLFLLVIILAGLVGVFFIAFLGCAVAYTILWRSTRMSKNLQQVYPMTESKVQHLKA